MSVLRGIIKLTIFLTIVAAVIYYYQVHVLNMEFYIPMLDNDAYKGLLDDTKSNTNDGLMEASGGVLDGTDLDEMRKDIKEVMCNINPVDGKCNEGYKLEEGCCVSKDPTEQELQAKMAKSMVTSMVFEETMQSGMAWGLKKMAGEVAESSAGKFVGGTATRVGEKTG